MNIDNLTRLAAFLELLPTDYKHFEMGCFFDSPDDNLPDLPIYATQANVAVCGSVACAVGHGILAGIPATPNDHSWTEYSRRVFGMSTGSRDWDWCFSGSWSSVDNTPHGAAKRIRYLIANGRAPEGFLCPGSCWVETYA